jgi:hypothetical protein
MNQALKQIIIFAIYLILVSGVYSSFTSLLNYIHKSHGSSHKLHAQIFFIINSVFVIIFNIIIPNIKNVNFKKLSIIASIAFFVNYLMTFIGFISHNETALLVLTIISSIFAGFGSCVVGLLSARYINYACELHQCKDK